MNTLKLSKLLFFGWLATVGQAFAQQPKKTLSSVANGTQTVTKTTTQTTTTQAKPQKFNIDENSDLESQATAIEHFVTEKDGQKHFDEQAAKAAGASDYLLEAGRAYNAFTESSSEEGFKIPVHGNYCGPGHSGPGAPVDKLDELCQTHDNCYGKKGYFSCSCDAELREGIKKNWGNFNGAGEKANAAAIFAAFSKLGCNPF